MSGHSRKSMPERSRTSSRSVWRGHGGVRSMHSPSTVTVADPVTSTAIPCTSSSTIRMTSL